MRVSLNLSALRKTRSYELAVRFFFGGAVTVFTGLIAKHYGPSLGGLFLAFPAIFPASATLLEKHEREKKKKAGIARTKRGRQAAALDAFGAALGTVGLGCFAVVIWLLMPNHNGAFVLLAATAAWSVVSIVLWRLRKSSLWP
jgi:Protein of unknown function (DUF3147)